MRKTVIVTFLALLVGVALAAPQQVPSSEESMESDGSDGSTESTESIESIESSESTESIESNESNDTEERGNNSGCGRRCK